MRKIFFIVTGFMIPVLSFGQMVTGQVKGKMEEQSVYLPGVNIYWAGSDIGTASDQDGQFRIFKPPHLDQLVFSFVGYQNDTVRVTETDVPLEVMLSDIGQMEAVEIVQRQLGAHIDRVNPILTQQITTAELCKAACCNLAESFETNATVDAYYSNAVTGARQIRMLGLDGAYVQLQTENVPNIRGLASPYGLEYIPGPWMESIQVSKGTASVKNGYEAIAGQINVEYFKPESAERAFLNLFLSDAGRKEANAYVSHEFNDRLGTLLMVHGSDNQQVDDHQGDGFLDHPKLRQVNLYNRWMYTTEHIHFNMGLKALRESRTTGQTNFSRDMPRDIDHPYGIGIDTDRYEAFMKLGYTFNNDLNTNFGSIFSVSGHQQNSFYGIRDYSGNQLNYYMNLMFQTDIRNNYHTLTTGYSLNYDDYDEMLDQTDYHRRELVNGVFAEYAFKPENGLIVQSGIRVDYHNLFGFMFTPRVHARYSWNEHTIFRASAGKGYRSPNVLAENNHFLANSRQILIADDLKQEEAWNYGLSVTQYFSVGPRQLTATGDVYRTSFINQIIVDLDSDVNEVSFSNLDGESFSNNYQVELSYELIRGLDARAAFRYSDVQYTLNNNLVEKPLVSKYKGLITASYATPLRKWQFDLTTQFNGPGRIPSTAQNPEPWQVPDQFDPYTILHAQITKYFRTWSIYLGAENLTDFTQHHPVIAADQPFGEYFDGSLIWGPLHGRKIYIGMRWALEKPE